MEDCKPFSIKETVRPNDPNRAADFLAVRTGLSKKRIKDAMTKGAVWIKKHGAKRERLRRATALLRPGDILEVYYDERLLAAVPPRGECLNDLEHYSAWFKPAGLMSQGTLYGDHCSLLRQAEACFTPRRRALPVHRLDREAAGLVIVAHTREAAAKLSDLFRNKVVVKRYAAEVRGDLSGDNSRGIIALPLDGKDAITAYEAAGYSREEDISTVNIVITTGRYHQIRRHFNMMGFPVMGDPRYGRGNKNTEGLKLVAVGLEFLCPFSGRHMIITLAEPPFSR